MQPQDRGGRREPVERCATAPILSLERIDFLSLSLIRITPMILEFCPDLSQRVKPIDKSSNHAKNAT
jgi:hypothetical protein